jgi:hypothetical protein
MPGILHVSKNSQVMQEIRVDFGEKPPETNPHRINFALLHAVKLLPSVKARNTVKFYKFPFRKPLRVSLIYHRK